MNLLSKLSTKISSPIFNPKEIKQYFSQRSPNWIFYLNENFQHITVHKTILFNLWCMKNFHNLTFQIEFILLSAMELFGWIEIFRFLRTIGLLWEHSNSSIPIVRLIHGSYADSSTFFSSQRILELQSNKNVNLWTTCNALYLLLHWIVLIHTM